MRSLTELLRTVIRSRVPPSQTVLTVSALANSGIEQQHGQRPDFPARIVDFMAVSCLLAHANARRSQRCPQRRDLCLLLLNGCQEEGDHLRVGHRLVAHDLLARWPRRPSLRVYPRRRYVRHLTHELRKLPLTPCAITPKCTPPSRPTGIPLSPSETGSGAPPPARAAPARPPPRASLRLASTARPRIA